MKYIKEIITITTTLTRNPEHTPIIAGWYMDRICFRVTTEVSKQQQQQRQPSNSNNLGTSSISV